MSPVEHQEGRFKIYIWPDEGRGSKEAPHVHVFTPDAEVKIGLAPVAVLGATRMKAADQRRALALVRANADRLLEAWRKWHDAQD